MHEDEYKVLFDLERNIKLSLLCERAIVRVLYQYKKDMDAILSKREY